MSLKASMQEERNVPGPWHLLAIVTRTLGGSDCSGAQPSALEDPSAPPPSAASSAEQLVEALEPPSVLPRDGELVPKGRCRVARGGLAVKHAAFVIADGAVTSNALEPNALCCQSAL